MERRRCIPGILGQDNWCWEGGRERKYITVGLLDQEVDDNMRSVVESLKPRQGS